MDDHRKQVIVRSDGPAFGSALRLVLDDCLVTEVSKPGEIPMNADLLVWQVDGQLPTEDLQAAASSVLTLVLADESQLIDAVNAGCRGFLPRSASLDEIHGAVNTMLQGEAVVPPYLLGTLLRHMVERRRRVAQIDSALSDLTDREREVFWMASQGARKEEIGKRLYMSSATARTHLQRIYKKLGIHSHSELIALAIRIGEIESEETE